MKRLLSKLLPYILSFEILTLSFFTCYISVKAADFMPNDIIAAIEYGVENNDWYPFWRFIRESSDGLMYLVSQMGAVANKEFTTWVDNNKKLESLIESNVVPAKKEDNNIVFTQDFMSQIKQALDDYAAENQPFTIEKTYSMNDIPASTFGNKACYDYFKSFFSSGSYNYVCLQAYSTSYGFIGDATPYIKEGGGFYNYGNIVIADKDWRNVNVPANKYNATNNENGDPCANITENAYSFTLLLHYVADRTNFFLNSPLIVTPDGGNIRVFKSAADFINYSAGQRKIYYATDYYNYVPEDLTVSIDDLQKSVDGLSDAVEKLQQQVTDDMSESEIEDLLQQILDELKNNQGGNTGGDNTGGGNTGGGNTGGGSTGGGDVNIDIDLSDTNTWLSKIHAKLTDMFEQVKRLADNFESFFIFENTGINAKYLASLQERILARLRALSPGSVMGDETGGDTGDSPGDGTGSEKSWLQEVLEDIRDTLKSIRRWSIADTVMDGVDAVADWLDLLRGVVADAGEGAGSAVAAVSSAVGVTRQNKVPIYRSFTAD